MPVTVQHVLTATTPDNTSYEIRPSHWNSAHSVSLNLSSDELIKWVSAGSTSMSSGTLQYSNGSGVTFGLATGTAGGTITGSVAATSSLVATGDLSLSVNGSTVSLGVATTKAGTGFTSTTTSGTALVGTLNTAGLSVGVPAWITTGAGGGVGMGVSSMGNTAGTTGTVTTGNVALVGSNNITLSQSSSGSNATISFIGPASSSLVAGANITISTNGSTITIIGGTAAAGSLNISAGTTSTGASNFTFADSNGVSFGLGTGANSQQITATVKTDYLTTARASTDAVGLNTAKTNVTWTVNSSGISLDAGGYLTTAMQSNAATISNINVSAGTTSTNASAFTFVDSNGLSFGLGTGANAGKITGTVKTDYLTTARGSTDAIGLNTAQTRVTWTVNSSGLSIDAGGYAGTGFTTTSVAGAVVAGTHDTAGLKLAVPAYLTTAMLSNAATISNINVSAGTTSTNASAFTFANAGNVSFGLGTGASVGSITATATFAQTNQSAIKGLGASNTGNTAGNTGMATGLDWVIAGTNNVTVSQSTSNATGPHTLWLSAPNAAAGVGIAAGTRTATTAGSLLFDTGNGITFGLNAVGGSIMTASHNALTTGAASTLSLFGTSNTTNNSSTNLPVSSLLFQGAGAATVGFSNGSIQISAPASSSVVGTSGVSISSNGSTFSIMNLPVNAWEPYYLCNSSTMVPGLQSWWFQPVEVPAPISGGRLNLLTVFGDSASLPRATTSASFGSNTSGQKSMRYQYSLSAVVYSVGAGTNSTRLESLWSNQHSFELSHNLSISGAATGGGRMTVSEGLTLSAIKDIDSAGGVTTTTFGGSSTLASAATNIDSTLVSSIHSSINNMLSSQLILPIPFNTTLNPGQYWFAFAYNTNSTTGGSSQVGFSLVNGIGNTYAAVSAHRMLGQTTTNVSSQVFPGFGNYSAASAGIPNSIAFSNIRTAATAIRPYFNYVNSQAITV